MADLDNESLKWMSADRALAVIYLASSTCVIYDHITTFGDEVELVWQRKRWSMVQYLFFINRYLGDATQIYAAFVFLRHIQKGTQENCNLINLMLGFLVSGVLCSMQAIMIYRVSSMYNHGRKVIAFLVGAVAVEMMSVTAIQLISLTRDIPVPSPTPFVHLCTQDSWSSWMYTIWIPIALFEFLILALSLSLAIKYYRSLQAISAILPPSETDDLEQYKYSDSLIFILLRDSITFPFICCSLCIINFFVWLTQPYVIEQISFAIAAFAPCIIGSRLILNLREAYYLPFIEECNPPASSTSRREFVQVDEGEDTTSIDYLPPGSNSDVHLITLSRL